jgi:hypothetical protein
MALIGWIVESGFSKEVYWNCAFFFLFVTVHVQRWSWTTGKLLWFRQRVLFGILALSCLVATVLAFSSGTWSLGFGSETSSFVGQKKLEKCLIRHLGSHVQSSGFGKTFVLDQVQVTGFTWSADGRVLLQSSHGGEHCAISNPRERSVCLRSGQKYLGFLSIMILNRHPRCRWCM